ncbi:MAG TPA: PCRF domain-containing protein, partial [Candidatus Saccharimonadales bacterium]|nr:PCRF domain-containing protein [Candidatus Saccharimonadales bacterium]
MQSLAKNLQELQLRIESAMQRLNLAADQQRLKQLEAETQRPGFWDNAQDAAAVSREAAAVRAHVQEWTQLHQDVIVARELAELGDASMQEDLTANYKRLQAEYAAREFELKLSGPHDREGAILTISAGAGGTDAQDWAEMLLRMY